MICPFCSQVHPDHTRVCPTTGQSIEFISGSNSRIGPWLWQVILGIGCALLVIGLSLIFWPQVSALFSAKNQPVSTPNLPTKILLATSTLTRLPAINATRTVTPGPTPEITGVPLCTEKGQTWIRPSDKAEMACVPAGSFVIGQSTCVFAGCEKEVNGGSVNLKAFWIDRSEVTNAQFSQFVAKTGFQTHAEQLGKSAVYGFAVLVSGANWRSPQGSGSSINGKSDHPVVQLNWFAASEFCSFVGGLLPTEAQWEKAARGTDGRLFPWGNDLPDDFLLNAADRNLPVPHARQDKNDGFQYTSPVGHYPAGDSPYGLHNMAGNAWEWTRNVYVNYPYLPSDGREIVGQPAPDFLVVLRGGSWYDDYGSVRSTLRYGGPAQSATDGTGFRCVVP